MHEDFTTEQLDALNRADRYLHQADTLFDFSNRAIHLAICFLRNGNLVRAYRLHNDAIEFRNRARQCVYESSSLVQQVYQGKGEHCHLTYRKDQILRSPARKITSQWCTLFYVIAGTMAVVAILFTAYMWRTGLL